MATGRTVTRWIRVYADGYDISGNTTQVGPFEWSFDDTAIAGLDWAVKGAYPGMPKISMGTLNGIFDNTAITGLHIIASGAGVTRTVMNAVGIRAAPACGDAVFCGKFQQLAYHSESGQTMLTATIPFGLPEVLSQNYAKPWGNLLHANGAETGANSGNTPKVDGGGATTAGGYMIYQITGYAGTGSATISVDDSANGTSWLALAGATTGALAHTVMPCAGIIELATTATVRQHLRFQVALNTLTSVSFALAFVRG